MTTRMMKRFGMIELVIALLVTVGAAAQAPSPAARAFDRYEAIRAALAKDGLVDVASNAAALAPLAAAVAGKDAEAAVNKVRAAKTLDVARDEFGNLSLILVPKFLEAELPGVVGYACTMKPNAVWVQRGESISNPYFGKVMLDCGSPLAKK